MQNNKLVIAAAGSGKTTYLIDEALKTNTLKILVTTYTQANEEEIKAKIFNLNGCIPENITVQTWFSFLLQHGAKPYQGHLFAKDITGLLLVNSQSGIKFMKGKTPVYYGEEKDFESHYFSKTGKIYSDKLSKFVFRCNEKSNGEVIRRLAKIYSKIYIDEVQDLAGYDLELLKLLFQSKIEMLLVGDPRQATYSTNSSSKNKKFKKSDIINFFEQESLQIESDSTLLLTNYRCCPEICQLSNKLFPLQTPTSSGNMIKTTHSGVFLIGKNDVDKYLRKYSPIQLRDSIKTSVNEDFKVMNFGESKGLSFDRVILYPTRPFIAWLKNNNAILAPTSKSKLYVAITRARHSVAIIWDSHIESIEGVSPFDPSELQDV